MLDKYARRIFHNRHYARGRNKALQIPPLPTYLRQLGHASRDRKVHETTCLVIAWLFPNVQALLFTIDFSLFQNGAFLYER